LSKDCRLSSGDSGLKTWQNAGFDDCSFLVSKVGQTQRIPFTSLRARTLWNGWFFDSIRIEVEKSTPILLKGIGRSKARIAFEKLASKIDEAASEHLKRNTEQILAVTHKIANALAGHRYIAHSEASQLCEQLAPHLFILWTRPNVPNIGILKIVRHLETFYSNHESIRVDANARFLATESVACADFFSDR
jgi:hypothetical protein